MEFNIQEKIKKFILQSRRVLAVAEKPDKDEFKQSVIITGLGIVIVGMIGFVLFMVVNLMGGL